MGMVGYREKTLNFACPVDYAEGRAVTITDATGTVAYTAAGASTEGVTVGPANSDSRFASGGASEYTIEVVTLGSITGSELVEAGAAVAKGDELEVGANGTFIPLNLGTTTGLFASGAAAAGELFGAYKK